MGYLDLNMAYAPAAELDAFTRPASTRGEIGEFSALEWKTILVARSDGLNSLVEPGRFGRFVNRAFGLSVRRGLADPRLEALRRFAVIAWEHGYTLPKSALLSFIEAGFSKAQVETLLASVAVARVTRR